MELVKHETCQQYVTRRLSEGWKIVWQEGYNLILSSPDGNILRPVDLRNDVETLRPNAAGSETSISSECPSGSDHYLLVDEETADDGSTYLLENTNTYHRDLYALPAHSEGSGTINKITVYFRCEETYSALYTSSRAKAAIRTGGVTYDGNEENISSTWTTYSMEWAQNPGNSHAWTWDEIDALEVGVSLKEGNPVSVVKGTRVLMADRSYKNIEDIKIGDIVVSLDLEEKQLVESKVIGTSNQEEKGYLALNDKLKVTPSHLVYSNGEYKPAGEIKVGDTLLDEGGREVEIFSVDIFEDTEVQVYDLLLEYPQNFFASGYLIHNGYDAKCTQVYVEVDYTPPAGRSYGYIVG